MIVIRYNYVYSVVYPRQLFSCTNHSLLTVQWSLVCSKESWAQMSQSVFFAGQLIGAFLWGNIADKIGRKRVLFLTLSCTFVSGLGYGLAPSYTIFALFRLMSAISCAGVILSSYVLSVEIVGISARSYAGLAGACFFSLSYPCLALLAFCIRSWRWLCVIISLLGLAYFPLWRYVHDLDMYVYADCTQ